MSITACIHGDFLGHTRQRVRLDPDAPSFTGRFRNDGPDPVRHSPRETAPPLSSWPPSAQGTRPWAGTTPDGPDDVTVAPGEVSGPITEHRWLRSQGKSNITAFDCRVEGVI